MKNYNPVSLELNMPVEYIAKEDTESLSKGLTLTGHFAFFDEDGTPYVWGKGGTSYSRGGVTPNKQYLDVIECSLCFPLCSHSQGIYRHENVIKDKYPWLAR